MSAWWWISSAFSPNSAGPARSMSALDFWYDFHSPFAYLAATRVEHIAHILERKTQEAVDRGVFGVPSIFWRKKLFFGNDRLDLLERSLSRRSAS